MLKIAVAESFVFMNRPLDSLGFHQLTPEPAQIKSLKNMLLFQYLVNALEGHLAPRNGKP
ncbi:hypothetical protein SADUNF_Sadunf04G0034000 [Salix dunnii]|uniref:Uncharacterized protein n=1 Tax=Salix dunnii TaxID=1413687 RepID=A0A835N2M2_9ROSI|nr:hypothetical protein SADUNF_Sadunf04G0034000 [Salix dunnii]